MERAHAQVKRDMRVGWLAKESYSRAEIAQLTDSTPAEVRQALARLAEIVPDIER